MQNEVSASCNRDFYWPHPMQVPTLKHVVPSQGHLECSCALRDLKHWQVMPFLQSRNNYNYFNNNSLNLTHNRLLRVLLACSPYSKLYVLPSTYNKLTTLSLSIQKSFFFFKTYLSRKFELYIIVSSNHH